MSRQGHLDFVVKFIEHPGPECPRLTTVFTGRVNGGQDGCGAVEIGSYSKKDDYRLNMYWAAFFYRIGMFSHGSTHYM